MQPEGRPCARPECPGLTTTENEHCTSICRALHEQTERALLRIDRYETSNQYRKTKAPIEDLVYLERMADVMNEWRAVVAERVKRNTEQQINSRNSADVG